MRGFSLLEMLIVLGILALLIGASVPAYTSFTNRYQVDVQSDDLTQLLRIAQAKSMASEGDDTYGVHLVSGVGGSFTLFKGATYATRDVTFDDEVHTLPNQLTLSDTITDPDVVFTKAEGSTSDIGVITIEQTNGTLFHTIDVNSVGRVDQD